MDKKKLYELVFGDNYYSIEDLRYNQKLGIMFSKDELSEFLAEKDSLIDEVAGRIKKLPLKTFNSKYCFYVKGAYLAEKIDQYLSTYLEDLELYKQPIFNRHFDDMLMSRLYSEVEGTLNVENVNITHKRVKEIFQKQELKDRNDVIIKNMFDAITYIFNDRPAFNKENLFKLYSLLSKDCLDEEDKLKEGEYYRDDTVSVGDFDGAPVSMIDECMNSLFDFVQSYENIKKYGLLIPHICHYYILYVHPYFDYNGRTARMVSFWLNLIYEITAAPMFISEAINDNKKDYYRAIINTRLTHNDLTYFLGYILETATKYSLLYKNLKSIKDQLSKKGDTLTSTEMGYLKKIIVHNPEGYFNYKAFLEYIQGSMTKAGALKALNGLTEYGLLEKSINKKKEAIYKVNQEMITYKYSK